MNDAATDLLVLIGQKLCLVVYEALLAVDHTLAPVEEYRSLGKRLNLLDLDGVNYLPLT